MKPYKGVISHIDVTEYGTYGMDYPRMTYVGKITIDNFVVSGFFCVVEPYKRPIRELDLTKTYKMTKFGCHDNSNSSSIIYGIEIIKTKGEKKC